MIRKTTLTTVVTLTIALLVIAAAPASASTVTDDLNQYTVAGIQDEKVDIETSDRLNVTNVNASSHVSVRHVMPEHDKEMTFEFEFNIEQQSGVPDFSIGVLEDSGTNGDTVYQDVLGLHFTGTNDYQLSLRDGTEASASCGQLSTNNFYHVDLTIDERDATANLLVFTNSGHGGTELCNVTIPIQAGTQYETIAALQTQGGADSSWTFDMLMTQWSIQSSEVENIGENFLTEYTITGGESVDDRDVSKNWISLDGGANEGMKVFKDIDATQSQVRMRFIARFEPSSDLLFNTYHGWSADNQSTAASITGFSMRHDDNNEEHLRTSNSYWDGTTQSINVGGTKYYMTVWIFPQNGTVEYRAYTDAERTNLAHSGSEKYPAAKPFPTFYAAILDQVDSGQHASIGHMRLDVLAVPNSGEDMTTGTLSGGNADTNTTTNWITINDGGVDYYFDQGPGTNDATLKFTWVTDNYQGSGGNMVNFVGWATDSAGTDLTGAYFRYDSNNGWHLRAIGPGGSSGSFLSYSPDTTYYGLLTKDGDTMTVSLYTDPERTNLHGNISVTQSAIGSNTYTHLFALHDSDGKTQIGIGESADLVDIFEGTITLSINPWMKHGSTQIYTVTATEGNTTITVTSEASVTSGNTTVITISGTKLIATSDTSINNQVVITANYKGATDEANVTVANRSLSNIEILPPDQYFAAALGFDDSDAMGGEGTYHVFGSEIQWIFVAIFIGAAAAWKARNEWLGIGTILGVLVLFWTRGFVGLGPMLVALFYGIFAAYQLQRTPSRSDTNVGEGVTNRFR